MSRGPRLSARGSAVLAGAAISYVAGWVFGTRELAALALALALAPALALALVWWAARTRVELSRTLPSRAVAGSSLRAAVSLTPAPPLVSATLVERCRGLGDPAAGLARVHGALTGGWCVDDPARGRYELVPELVVEDPLGLARVRVRLPSRALVRIEPLLVELAAPRSQLFADHDGSRYAFASSAGDGIAGVRDHEVGESLRRVHWRTTARRGRLTVRELEEHPRDELFVVLDAASRDPGQPARSAAFECAVRAAGSLALHAVRAGMAVSFASTGRQPMHVEIGSTSAAAALLDALCAVERDGAMPLAGSLPDRPGARLCIVSADISPGLVERLRSLRARRRAVALVAIDEASFEGAEGSVDAAAGELAAIGVDVAIVRADGDLARSLSGLARAGVSGAA